MKKLTPFLLNGSPKLCWGCGNPFPVREDRMEALLGQDGRLYCYGGPLECAEMAMKQVETQRAA